jgi:hypothetical protein
MIAAVESTRGALSGDPVSLYSNWLQLLGVFDIVFTVLSFWAFEWILDA